MSFNVVRLASTLLQKYCISATKIYRFSSTLASNAYSMNNLPVYLEFHPKFTDEQQKQQIIDTMKILDNFITPEEETLLQNEFEPYMKKLRYETDHWDDAIHGYRETERLKWNVENTKILDRVRNVAFPAGTPQIKFVHILDLQENGVIKPHVDSVRFCGNTITGLSLFTDSVMRLVHSELKDNVVDVLLQRRSLYIMTGSARYDYTHEILANKDSVFKGNIVKKARRVSIICRNEPTETKS